MPTDNPEQQASIVYQQIADKYTADIFIFNGSVLGSTVDKLISSVRKVENRADNCILLLTTLGGDPDAGYRAVRTIKRYYKQFILFVFGDCKSTGTLMALGADKIVMSDFSELGPLDIQLPKDDELVSMSGLNYFQSLVFLNQNMFNFFESNFFSIKESSGGTISTRTAAEIASKLAIGLLSPISGQIDPIRLGEVQRAMTIGSAYGRRLCENGEDTINRLVIGYPSHGFVIDLEEAKDLFPNVEEAGSMEKQLEELLFSHVRTELRTPLIGILKAQKQTSSDSSENEAAASPPANAHINQSVNHHTNQENGSQATQRREADPASAHTPPTQAT